MRGSSIFPGPRPDARAGAATFSNRGRAGSGSRRAGSASGSKSASS